MILVLQELYCELKKFFWSDLRQHIVGRRTRGYLLYGPQGSGKKFLAECIAGVSWSFALLSQAVTNTSVEILKQSYPLDHVNSPQNWIITHFGHIHFLDMHNTTQHNTHNNNNNNNNTTTTTKYCEVSQAILTGME